MKYKNYPVQIWSKLQSLLAEKTSSRTKAYAAFDADGTLWDTDLGETFFKFQINNNLLPNLPKDPWSYYRNWKESGDPRPAYLWLAQINSGVPLSTVRQWAEEAVQQFNPLPLFEEQKKIIDLLHQKQIEVFVVTASVKWAVEPGALRLGIDHDHVIGIETEIKDGHVTDKQKGVITYREGKVDALLEKTNNEYPIFSSGNTMGDFALLKASRGLSLAVGAAQPNDELWKTENELRQEAIKHNWLLHHFDPTMD